MARSLWRGAVTFGMVTIPVKLYAATESHTISFHQLHKGDHGRIKYRKVCELDDKVLQPDEIVRGYEIGKGQYVEIEESDLAHLPVASQHAVEITSFVGTNEIDPIYYDKSYYVEPEQVGLKPFSLLLKALRAEQRLAVAKIALRDKERICVLRPMESGALVLETLFYPDEVRLDEAPKVPDVLASEKELAMARQLVEALEEPFDPAAYRDTYREAVLDIVARKQGEKGGVVEEPDTAVTPKATQDLLAALRASVEGATKGRAKPKTADAPKKPAAEKVVAEKSPTAAKAPRRRKVA